jgi:hypothetical protein
MKKTLLLCGVLVMLFGWHRARAEESNSEVASSTMPLGSPYYRFLANDFDIDLRELVKFERKGFGRSEIAMLVVLSGSDVKKLKALGNRRIKDQVSMETLAKEAGYNYRDLVKVAREIKADIEAKGDKDLPPPVFPTPSVSPSPTPKAKKSPVKDKGKSEVKPK